MHLKKLSKDEENIFEKYSGEDAQEEQKYVYEGLKSNDSKKRSQAIDDLIQYTVKELELQYRRKEGFDNKTGLILAFLSIAFSIFIQSDFVVNAQIELGNLSGNNNIFIVVLLIGVIVAFIVSLYFCLSILYSKDLYSLSVSDRKNNYKSAIDDPSMFKVGILEMYTEAFISNNEVLNKMSKKFNKCVISIAVYLCEIIVTCFIR